MMALLGAVMLNVITLLIFMLGVILLSIETVRMLSSESNYAQFLMLIVIMINAECRYAGVVLPSAIIQNVIILIFIDLRIVIRNVMIIIIVLRVVVINVVMLIICMLHATILIAIELSVDIIVVILSVCMLNAIEVKVSFCYLCLYRAFSWALLC
jgi:hypothetical protein